jgi:hypothetical protein
MKKATERARTADLRFTKPLLYQLSYGGDNRKLGRKNHSLPGFCYGFRLFSLYSVICSLSLSF